MLHLPPPPPAAEVRLVQVLTPCGSYRPGGQEVATPWNNTSQLGCSAPIGDGSGGWVRIKPGWPPGTVRVEPDAYTVPNYGPN